MTNLNTTLFLLVNQFARATVWLNGVAVAYASYEVGLFGPGMCWSGLSHRNPAAGWVTPNRSSTGP